MVPEAPAVPEAGLNQGFPSLNTKLLQELSKTLVTGTYHPEFLISSSRVGSLVCISNKFSQALLLLLVQGPHVETTRVPRPMLPQGTVAVALGTQRGDDICHSWEAAAHFV